MFNFKVSFGLAVIFAIIDEQKDKYKPEAH